MLKLTDELRIGHDLIDGDHQKLIDIINEFQEHSRVIENERLMHETLKALLTYGREHFEREEAVQRSILYPMQRKHFHEHKFILDQIHDIARSYFVTKSRKINTESIAELNSFLKLWLVGHVKNFDTVMRDWVKPNPVRVGTSENDVVGAPSPDMVALIIGSNPAMRMPLISLASAMGFAKVESAESGVEGINLVFGDTLPDLVLCELGMEPVDGASVVGAIRSSLNICVAKLPVLIFSDADNDDSIRKSMLAGATGAFLWPFDRLAVSQFLCQIMRS